MRSTSPARTLLRDGKSVALTTGEFSLLKVFVQHPRQPLAREKLMMLARGRDHEVFDRAIDVQVSRLRKLVEPDPANPRYIQTVWGFGYVYVPDWRRRRTTRRRRQPHRRRRRTGVTLLPRSLFGRLVLLLVAVVALAVLTSVLLFRHDRAELLTRQFSETKFVQLQALRAALEGADGPQRRETLQRLNREYGVRIVPEAERPIIGQPARADVQQTWKSACGERLGPETEVRFAPRLRLLFVRVVAGDDGYWIGFPVPARPQDEDIPSRALTWTLIVLARCCWRPPSCSRATSRGRCANSPPPSSASGRGETPPPLPETGPSEIAAVNRGFNAMIGNLRQIEQRPRRAAGRRVARPAHAARAAAPRRRDEHARRRDARRHGRRHRGDGPHHRPVPRLRARRQRRLRRKLADLNAIVAACVERYVHGWQARSRSPPARVPPLPLKATAISRLVANLIDNALAYGAPPVEVTTSRAGGTACGSTSPIAAPAFRPTRSSG